jgi:hypothetical protein
MYLLEGRIAMKKEKPAKSPGQREKELCELKERSLAMEKEISKLLNDIDGNSKYRNDIIWLAGEINTIQKKIKDVEART